MFFWCLVLNGVTHALAPAIATATALASVTCSAQDQQVEDNLSYKLMPRVGQTEVNEWPGLVRGSDGGLWRLTGVLCLIPQDSPPTIIEQYECIAAVATGVNGSWSQEFARKAPPACIGATWENQWIGETETAKGEVWRVDSIEVRNMSLPTNKLIVHERWTVTKVILRPRQVEVHRPEGPTPPSPPIDRRSRSPSARAATGAATSMGAGAGGTPSHIAGDDQAGATT